jgi:hypothetical protein
MPCFNSGKCYVENSKFRCECQPGFHGNYCEAGKLFKNDYLKYFLFNSVSLNHKKDLRRCTSSPCPNGCECVEMPFNMTFKCDCKKDSNTNEFQDYQTKKTTNGRRMLFSFQV